MKLPNCEQLAARFLEGTEKGFDTRVALIDARIDRFATCSAVGGNSRSLPDELTALLAMRAAMQSARDAVREYREERGLSRAHSDR